jgi:hypothetical protein
MVFTLDVSRQTDQLVHLLLPVLATLETSHDCCLKTLDLFEVSTLLDLKKLELLL